jgi:hypothetical protein
MTDVDRELLYVIGEGVLTILKFLSDEEGTHADGERNLARAREHLEKWLP